MPRQPRDTPRDAFIKYFGRELRAAREAAGLSQPQLAAELGYTHQWIGKVERGESAPSDTFVTDLETFFKAEGRFQRLRDEIKDAHRNQVLLPGFPEYLELERRSVRMRSFHGTTFPGLLQTPEYARGVMSAGQTPAALEEMVTGRVERQTLLTQDDPLSTWFVIDEAVLRRSVGTRENWRAQLAHLINAAELPNVRIWILPFSSVTYAALDAMPLSLS